MVIHMLTLVVFLSAFMIGAKAGVVGTLIGVVVGMGMGLVFHVGIGVLWGWGSSRFGRSGTTQQNRLRMFVGWLLVFVSLMWLVLNAASAHWLTRFLLAAFQMH